MRAFGASVGSQQARWHRYAGNGLGENALKGALGRIQPAKCEREEYNPIPRPPQGDIRAKNTAPPVGSWCGPATTRHPRIRSPEKSRPISDNTPSAQNPGRDRPLPGGHHASPGIYRTSRHDVHRRPKFQGTMGHSAGLNGIRKLGVNVGFNKRSAL